MYELQMPKFGQTMTEGEIDEWKVQVGDHVEKEQELCIVSTDKITNGVKSYRNGTVKEILVEEGEKAPIGAVIARIEEDA